MRLSIVTLSFILACACTPKDDEDGDGGANTPAVPETSEAVCYDTDDNDHDGFRDCEDSDCQQFPTCCVGSADDACCESGEPVYSLSVAGCNGTSIPLCAPSLTEFGEPGPFVRDEGIATSNSPSDNGAYLADTLDVRRATIEITFEAAQANGCVGDCLNYIALGLTTQEPQTGTGLFSMQLAVAIRPNFGDIAFILGGDIIDQWPLTDTAFHRYKLRLTPDGRISFAEIDETGAATTLFVPPFFADMSDSLYLAIVGRGLDLENGVPARVRSISIERGVCDFPASAGAEAEPVIPSEESASTLPRVDGVGRAKNKDDLEAVIADVGSEFRLLLANSSGEYVATSDPILTLADVPGAVGIDDPWLVADEDNMRWQLFFTVRTSANSSSIGRISSMPGFGEQFDNSSFVIVAEPAAGFPKLEMPTVVGDHLIARAANVDLGIFVSLRPEGPDRWVLTGPSAGDSSLHRPKFSDIFAMDNDEIADPALVYDDGRGMFRLYFAGRRGTRWRMGLLVSVNGEDWYQPLGDEELWRLDERGFDALGVRDPAPILKAGQASILYVGIADDSSMKVGHATSGASSIWPSP